MVVSNKIVCFNLGTLIRNNIFWDLLFLIATTILVQGYFVASVGFYSDDWNFLSILSNSDDQSVPGLIYNFFVKDEVVRMRPIQVIELSILYWLFGINPLGYHLFNSFVFSVVIIFFYLILEKHNLPRLLIISIPLIYALLPHYSTARMWLATFSTNLSVAFFFINFYANVKYVGTQKSISFSWSWLFISLSSLLISILAYEVILPLFAINFSLTWIKSRKQSNLRNIDPKCTILLYLNLLLLILCVLFKAGVSVRTGGFRDGYINQVFGTIKSAVKNDFITYGVSLPKIIWRIFLLYKDDYIFTIASLLGLFIFIYLIRMKIDNYKLSAWIYIIVGGLIIYLGGYAIFLTTVQIQITPTGISNRVTMAASLGVATCLFGVIGLVSYFIKVYWMKKLFFSAGITIICTCGYIINCTIATFYVKSYSTQLSILNNIYTNMPKLTPGSIIILDGTCPYIGPAPIFECYWDIGGALQIYYHTMKVRADVRTSKLTYSDKGLITTIYGEEQFYPFNKHLIIYNNQSGKHYLLKNSNDAKLYFTTPRCAKLGSCPKGEEGYGVPIF